LNYLTRFTNLSHQIPESLRSGWRWLPGPIAAAVVIGLVRIGASQPVEDFAYNRLTELRGERAWDDRVVVVEIDNASAQDRGKYTKFLNIIQKYNPSAIAFEQIFSEPTPGDDRFVDAIARNKAVILAKSCENARQCHEPSLQLKEAAQGIGHIDKVTSHDGVVRRIQFYKTIADSRDPLTKSSLESPLAWMVVEGHNMSNYPAIERPKDEGSFWINWPAPIAKAHHEKFDLILNRPKTEAARREIAKKFNNKIVLVGVTDDRTNSISTPFDRAGGASTIYLQAAIVDNLLQHDRLHIITEEVLFMILLGISPLLSYQLSRFTPGQRLVAIGILSGGWISIATIALASNYLLPVVAPITLIVSITMGVAYCERQYTDFLVENQIDRLWQTYQINLVPHAPHSRDTPLFAAIPVGKVAKLATLAADLGRSQSAQAAIAHSLSMGLIATELDGTVWFCNPIASQLLNINIGNKIQHFLVPDWLTLKEWKSTLHDLQVDRTLPAKEVKRNDKFFSIKLEPLFNWREIQRDILDDINTEDTSVLSGFLVLIEDVTAPKQLQSLLIERERHRQQELTKENIALEKARQLAESAGKMKSAFLANMSHEIRTPMNGVVSLTELLLETKLNDEQRDFVETIRSSSDTLLNIINEILDFSKIEAGEMQLEKINFNVTNCVEQVIEVLANNAYSKGIELSCRVEPNIPAELQGDPTRLTQVLTNLIGNAIKFTDTGGVSIDISAIATTDRQTTLYFQVQDTGIGIATDSQEKIFQSFSQADSSTTRQYGGTGLGLAISKRLVGMMGGEIGVISAPNDGSSFWFTLTCTIASAIPGNSGELISHHQKLTQIVRGKRILVAGNWEHSRRAIAAVAEHYGAIVTTTASSTAVLNLLLAAVATAQPFHILITDLSLVDSPHSTLPEQISHYPELASLQTIATIAFNEYDLAQILQERSQIASYMFKPAKPLSLINRSAELIDPTKWSNDLHPSSSPASAAQVRSHLRILVAEDNKVNQKVALNQLKNLGYKADLANDGEEVLVKLAERDYDAILMDCQMPKLDGYATTREIRQREGNRRHTIIIALTASAMKEDLELAMAAGMDDFLSKPVRKEELDATLTQWTQAGQFYLPAPASPVVTRLPIGMSPQIAPLPVDLDYLHQISEGDSEFERTILQIFVKNTQEQLQLLRNTLADCNSSPRDDRDLLAIQYRIHEIKGASANVGAIAIEQLAIEVEALLANSDLKSIDPLLSKIEGLTHTIGSMKVLSPSIQQDRSA
jgi:signal transduction histidine kinase/CHASE2 domain-containing sensor protein/DNA-binding response OmpR family regulator